MKHFILTAALSLAAAPVFAADLASGDQIKATITGNSVVGNMLASGAYNEYYQADGTIKGQEYTGKWSIQGDKMCFDYGEGDDCWSVRINGDQVAWVKEGEDLGTGTVVKGNPSAF